MDDHYDKIEPTSDDIITEGRRLLEAATERPWTNFDSMDDDRFYDHIAMRGKDWKTMAFAVNNLGRLLDVAEEARKAVDHLSDQSMGGSCCEQRRDALDKALTALRAKEGEDA